MTMNIRLADGTGEELSGGEEEEYVDESGRTVRRKKRKPRKSLDEEV